MDQGERDKVIVGFKKGSFPVLVATDVAGGSSNPSQSSHFACHSAVITCHCTCHSAVMTCHCTCHTAVITCHCTCHSAVIIYCTLQLYVCVLECEYAVSVHFACTCMVLITDEHTAIFVFMSLCNPATRLSLAC